MTKNIDTAVSTINELSSDGVITTTDKPARTEKDFLEQIESLKKLRSRFWILSIPADSRLHQSWHPDDTQITDEYVEKKLSKYNWAGQVERGKNGSDKNPEGYLHYQIYVQSPNAISAATIVRAFPRVHAEVVKSIGASTNYVMKEDTRVRKLNDKRDELKLEQSQGKRTDLDGYYELIKEGKKIPHIIAENPRAAAFENRLRAYEYSLSYQRWGEKKRQVTLEYWYGDAGAGKSTAAEEQFGFAQGVGGTYWVSDWSQPWDDYQGEDVLIFEEFRSQIPLSLFLYMCDGRPISLHRRFKNIFAQFTKIIIITNRPPQSQYENIKQEDPETHLAYLRRISLIKHYYFNSKNERTLEESVPYQYTMRTAA